MLTVRVTLNLDNHLLHSPDSLVATLLRHLLAHVVLGSLDGLILSISGLLLVLVGHVGLSLTLEIASHGRYTSLCTVLVVATSVLRIVHTLVGSLIGSIGSLLAVERLVLVVGRRRLILEVGSRQLWGLMPSVILGGLVDLV